MVLKQRIQEAQNTIARVVGGSKKAHIVFRSGVPCADIKSHTLYIPPISNDLNDESLTEFRAYVDHETLHLKYTIEEKAKNVVGDLQNTLEDSRIEKLGGQKYRGIKRNITYLNQKMIPKLADKDLQEFIQTFTVLQSLAHNPTMVPYSYKEMLEKFPKSKKWIDKLPAEILERVKNIEKEESVKNLAETICRILAIEKMKSLQPQKKLLPSEKQIQKALNQLISNKERNKLEKIKEQHIKEIVEKIHDTSPYTCNDQYDKIIKVPKEYGNSVLKLIQNAQREIAYIKSRLLRLSYAYKPTKVRGVEKGKLDSIRIANVDISENICIKRIKQILPDKEAFSILVDMSGSMSRKMADARQCVAIIGAILDQLRKPFEVLGWSGSYQNKEVYKEVARKTRIDYYIFKSFTDSFGSRMESLNQLKANEQNVDGEAVYWAACRLSQRPEKKKILIVISDGLPEDGATRSSILRMHLHKVVKDIEIAKINIIGIGLDSRGIEAVKTFYKNAVCVKNTNNLTTQFLGVLNKILLKQNI